MLDNYPLISYPLSTDEEDALLFYVMRDISTRVNIILTEQEKDEYFETVAIREGMRPEDIAHEIYNDESLWWTVLFANEMHDYLHDWYKSEPQILEYTIDKYGENNVSALHSIVDDYGNKVGTVFEQGATYTADSVSDRITVSCLGHGYISTDRIYLHFTSGTAVTGAYEIYSIPTPDSFVVEATITSNTSGSCTATKIAPDSLWLYNGNAVTNPSFEYDVRGLTNYEYELLENEKKRYIRVIKPKYITNFVATFKDKVADAKL
jgi:hypothetical protein